ncbi:MAG: hypothetical protein EOO22_07955 [Comamonadaceae bacterium]|nr:MAG: hypothetical protein EOO22_07955 [Comamonadaceae bacterium]
MNQPTPAIVAQSAVRRLPRLALILLCAAYLLPGLVGRGPWKSADIAAFGFMSELAATPDGLARWLDPMLLDLRPESPALIPYWLGAWAIRIAPGWINPDLAVRIVFALLLWGTFMATWYAVYCLARTPRAQPVAFAFGGEARPVDYARAMADGGLLALVASLGLAELGHETTPALAQLFFSAVLFYGVAALPFKRTGPSAAVFVGGIGLALSGAPTMALIFGVGSLAIAASRRRHPAGAEHFGSHASEDDSGAFYPVGALITIAAATASAAVLASVFDMWRWHIDWIGSQGGSVLGELRSEGKLLLWFTWPAWPLALWTLWRWRRQWTARHVVLPLLFTVVPLAAMFTTHFSERSLLLALPALATLAAFALPTFRRSASAAIDWFTLLLFSGLAAILWVTWIAMMTGFPAKPAANVAKLAPGFVPEFSLVAFFSALVATLAWGWLVSWRTGRHRAALWKSLVLPAGGVSLCWLLLMTLWLPAFDYRRGYVPQVRAVVERVGQPACIAELGLSRQHIAALRHHGKLVLEPLTRGETCPWLLVSPEALGRLLDYVSLEQWRLSGTLRRPISASDDLLLFQRVGPSAP